MDATKIFTILSGFLLIICLVLSITALTVMRNAVEESRSWQERAQSLVAELDACLREQDDKDSIQVSTPNADKVENSKESTLGLVIRTVGERIGIYTAEGALLYRLNVSPATLTAATQEALSKGIRLESWQELLALLGDLDS